MMYIDMMIESMLLEAYAEGGIRVALEKARELFKFDRGATLKAYDVIGHIDRRINNDN